MNNRPIVRVTDNELAKVMGWLRSVDATDAQREIYASILEVLTIQYSDLQPLEQAKRIQAVFLRLISTLNQDSATVADIIAILFARLASVPATPIPALCRLYDVLYGLYWCGAQRFLDMQRFDSKAVIPFSEFLERNAKRRSPVEGKSANGMEKLRVGYFCHYAHEERGNAVSPLIKAIVLTHAERSDREIFLYCVQWSSESFVRSFPAGKVTVRDIPQKSEYDRLDELVKTIRADGIDVLITDIASSISTYVFMSRAAPMQLWIDMGFPFWSIRQLDWVLLPGKHHQTYFGIDANRYSYLRLRQSPVSLKTEVRETDLIAARQGIPASAFIVSVFTRFSKITPEYLGIIRRLLLEIGHAHFLLVGSGESGIIDAFVVDPSVSKRVTIIRRNVDLNVYGRIIDVFLDTFPFIGGLSCREVGVHGKPVVSMLAGDWDRLIQDERDQRLVARNEDEYCAIVGKLASDREFYASSAQVATEMMSTFVSTGDMIQDIESGLALALAKGSVCKDQPQLGWFSRIMILLRGGKGAR